MQLVSGDPFVKPLESHSFSKASSLLSKHLCLMLSPWATTVLPALHLKLELALIAPLARAGAPDSRRSWVIGLDVYSHCLSSLR
jgi:hypothetical protein